MGNEAVLALPVEASFDVLVVHIAWGSDNDAQGCEKLKLIDIARFFKKIC